MSEAEQAAREIMALVDEFPSEPLSFERKQVLEKLEDLISRLHDIHEDAKESYYQLGHEEGYGSGREDSDLEIEELRDKISELEEAVQEAHDKGFDEGYDRASIDIEKNYS
jgi:flagellar biosynthesis/type III secretory pathway protein FliH